MKQQLIQEDSDSEYKQEVVDKTINDKETKVKVTYKQIQVRPGVLERQKWEKWGEVSNLPRGQFREGDMLVEAELRIQAANNQEECNFVIPPPKQLFVVSFDKESSKPQANQQVGPRQIGQSIQFEQAPASSQWLVIVSNLVQFEYAETFQDIIRAKDDFRGWLRKQLDQEEGRFSYYINFLQNRRKQKVYSLDGQNSHQPLIQKVMLKFQDKNRAEIALEKLNGKSYDGCILQLELQEQRPR
ncbi:unnamed protein product [Paramecium octaurelia]|uniref:Uncharacterized protein n=1 Tax=Paramecium octaurelia TaxID=43137 RepID=A0A8S1V1N9_PAROT|nr:unnamed protein product [Paramecium octaurelia]